MAIDSDNSISLPAPPPPRPAARRDAIQAALRKFDGVEDAAANRPSRSWWVSHQRPLGALATAAILAVVSIPVALTVLKDQPRPTAKPAEMPAAVQSKVQPPAAPPRPQANQSAETVDVEVPRSKLPLEPHETRPAPSVVEEQKANAAAAPAFAAAPPPPAPPPPPPPAPAPERADFAVEAEAQDVVVSGSRVRQQEIASSQHGLLAVKRAADAANASPMEAYGKFLFRLQDAVRSGNPRAVSALVRFPLRVNFSAGPRTYTDRKSVEKDADRIFTPRVKAAILAQRADQLFIRDQGAMIGDGEVWFDQVCRNSDCSRAGPVRIKAVNP